MQGWCWISLCLCVSQAIAQRFALPDVLAEVSGLYVATADSLWWHNDSGNRPVLYCTDGQGRLKDSIVLSVPNRDWEDLTADAQGHMFIGDFGNNRNTRTDLIIWRLSANEPAEPQPIAFSWPDQRAFPPSMPWRNFDCEAFFYYRDSLYLLSKDKVGRQRGRYRTKLYVLPDSATSPLVAHLLDSLWLKNRVVTGAALSPDGTQVALIAYDFRFIFGFLPWSRASIFVFEGWQGKRLSGLRVWRKHVSWLLPTQYEAIDFLDDQHLLIGRERTPFTKQLAKVVSLRRLRPWRKQVRLIQTRP